MRETRIVRKIDKLGRIVIPKEMRRALSISEYDPIEIIRGEGGTVILKKFIPSNESQIESIERVVKELKSAGYKKNNFVIVSLMEAAEVLKQKNSQPTAIDCES